jgi:hypothetical protein
LQQRNRDRGGRQLHGTVFPDQTPAFNPSQSALFRLQMVVLGLKVEEPSLIAEVGFHGEDMNAA